MRGFGTGTGSVQLTIKDLTGGSKTAPRLFGKMHYGKFGLASTGIPHSGNLLGNSNESGAINWSYGLMSHDNYWGTWRDYRSFDNNSGQAYNRGNYQLNVKSGNIYESDLFDRSKPFEIALLDMGQGSIGYVRQVDGIPPYSGGWRIVYVETVSTGEGTLQSKPRAEGIDTVQRLSTVETDYIPSVQVQHSFATLGNSDGAGQVSGVAGRGAGVQATNVGNVETGANGLQLSADGVGGVVYPLTSSDYVISFETETFDDANTGVYLRFQNADNHLVCELDSTANSLVLYEVVGGVKSPVVSVPFTQTDNYDLPSGERQYWTVDEYEGNIHVRFMPGSAHDTYLESNTTRFAGTQAAGPFVSRSGTAVATARNFVVYDGIQQLPEFDV